MNARFRGSWVALTTPFSGGSLDLGAWRASLGRQREAGSDGLVVAGTTGEGATLSDDERAELYAEAERLGLPWLASVGVNDTLRTIQLAEHARVRGAHGLLVATPAYSRPSQRGLLSHFEALARATPLPIVLYNVPARTAVDLEPQTAVALARQFENIVAIKEASGDPSRIATLRGELDVLWGDDRTLASALDRGAHGAISVLGNLFPALLGTILAETDAAARRELLARLAPFDDCLYEETNPGPLKACLGALGHQVDELRLPLVSVEPKLRRKLATLLVSQKPLFLFEAELARGRSSRSDELTV